MNVYLSEVYKHHHDIELLEKLVDCDFKSYSLEKDELKENSLIIIEPNWVEHMLQSRPDLVNIKNKKILILHHAKSQTFNKRLKYDFMDFMSLGFDPKNIYTISQLEYDVDFILNEMPGTNAISYDRWLMQLFERQIIKFMYDFNSPVEPIDLDMKRFSVFIRRFNQIRFNFICDLIENNLLNNFHYTFAHHIPVGDRSVTLNDIKMSIPERFINVKSEIESWVDGMPYAVALADVYEVTGYREWEDYPLNLSQYFNNSRINIVVETEPNEGASFITEKTYKAMLFNKPFIIVSQQNGLKALRKGGYQTFGHVIDESYDDISDYEERVQAVIKEIIRLNNMPEGEFNNLINACQPMVEHNHSHLFEMYHKPIPKEYCIKALTTF